MIVIPINLNLSTTNVTEGTNLYWTQTRFDNAISVIAGQPTGLATLDGGGKVPASQLPNSVMELKGQWNANTNTPNLVDGTGNAGDVWEVTTAGTTNFGSGNITFRVGDWAVYGADGLWYKSKNSNEVTTVNGLLGDVPLTGTANRVTISSANVFDIASTYVGQTSITTLGTVTTGTLGNGIKVLLGSDATGDIYYNGGSGVLSRSDSFNYASATPTLLVNGTTANSYFDPANRGFFVVSGGSTSHGWNPIFTAGIGTGFPSIQLYSSTSTNYSTIFWQSASHSAATTSATGNLAVISCFENGTKGVWRLAVADPFGGGFTPIRIFQTLGQNIALGSGGTATPTSYVHFAAGAAGIGKSFAKYTSGAKLGTAEVGAWEFVTDDLFFTGTTGTTRKTIADYAYRSTATTLTADGRDNLIVVTSGSNAITVPTAVGYTKELVLKNLGTGTVPINTTSSQTIDGYASGTLNLLQYEFMRLRSNNTNWIIVG